VHQHDELVADTAGQRTAKVSVGQEPGGLTGLLLSLAALGGNAATGRLLSQSVAGQTAAVCVADEGPLAQWNSAVAAVAAGPIVKPRPALVNDQFEDPAFNPTARAHDLLRAIDSEEHPDRLKMVGKDAIPDIDAERRAINFPAVVAALDGLTGSQVKRVEEIYFGFERLTTLREDLFGGGQSKRKADLSPEQLGRLEAMLRGTKPEPIPPEIIAELRTYPLRIAGPIAVALKEKAVAEVALNRYKADALELRELLSTELTEDSRERIMTLHRRHVSEISAVDAMYKQHYGEEALTADFTKRFPNGLQRARLALLRDGETAKADACAIEDKRRQIEALTPKPGVRVHGLPEMFVPVVDKEKQKLISDIQNIIELNKREALDDKNNAGRLAGDVVAERLGKIMNLPSGDTGGTLGTELDRTLGTGISGLANPDPRAPKGSSNIVRAAAAQLAADERSGVTSPTKVMETLGSFRKMAQHDLVAMAYDPAVPAEQKQAILRDGEQAVSTLANRYIAEYREAYTTIIAGKGRSYEQIVAGFDDADERLINNLAGGGGAASDQAVLAHAMAKKDFDTAVEILRRQPNREKVNELIAGYRPGDLSQELFAMAGGGRKSMLVAEQLYKPTAAEMTGQDGQAAEAKWITGAGQGEFDFTKMGSGIIGMLREIGADPETQRLLERSHTDLVALSKRFDAEQDPVKRERMLVELRKLRDTLTGDAAAYEEDNKRMLEKVRSAVTFAVSIALAVAIPGAGPGLASFLLTTAANVAANVAANFVIKMGDYGWPDLKADVLGGVLSAGGAKLGEELLGQVVAVMVKPAGKAAVDTAAKAGARTALSKEVGSLAAAGEQAVIKAGEVEAKIAGRALAETAAREVGGFFGGLYGPKVLTGDFKLTLEEFLQAFLSTAAGKYAHRNSKGKAEEPTRPGEEPARRPGHEPESGSPAPAAGGVHSEPAPANADAFGSRAPSQMLLDNGIPAKSAQGFQRVADVFDVVIKVRPTNKASLPVLEAGGVAKPELIKSKTVTQLDRVLGAPEGSEGKVGFFQPEMPPHDILATLDDNAKGALQKRHDERKYEYERYQQEYNELVAEGIVRIENKVVQIIDPRTGKFHDIGGDHDLFEITHADGTPIDHDVRRSIVTRLRSMGINVEHPDLVSWRVDDPKSHNPKMDADIQNRHATTEPLVAFVPKSQPREVMAGDLVTGPERTNRPGDRHLPAKSARATDEPGGPGTGEPDGQREPAAMTGRKSTEAPPESQATSAAYRMAAELSRVRREWRDSSPDRRAALLVAAASNRLGATGLPVPKVTAIEGTNSGFNTLDWEIQLGSPALFDRNPSPEAFALAAEHARHEVEHAVLDFRIARREVGRMDAAAVAQQLSIRAEIVQRAIEANASGNYEPITGTPLETESAQIIASLRDHRGKGHNKVMRALFTAEKALELAEYNAERAGEDPDTVKAVKKAKRTLDKAHEDYEKLPHEAKAWSAGRQVHAAVLNLDNLLSQLAAASREINAHQAAILAAKRSGATAAIEDLYKAAEAAQQKLDELVEKLAYPVRGG
jgi:hypothetical protein